MNSRSCTKVKGQRHRRSGACTTSLQMRLPKRAVSEDRNLVQARNPRKVCCPVLREFPEDEEPTLSRPVGPTRTVLLTQECVRISGLQWAVLASFTSLASLTG